MDLFAGVFAVGTDGSGVGEVGAGGVRLVLRAERVPERVLDKRAAEVVEDADAESGKTLFLGVRFKMTCCAADAMPIEILVRCPRAATIEGLLKIHTDEPDQRIVMVATVRLEDVVMGTATATRLRELRDIMNGKLIDIEPLPADTTARAERTSSALAMSPSASVRAFLHSITLTPVFSRSSLTMSLVISIVCVITCNELLRPGPEGA